MIWTDEMDNAIRSGLDIGKSARLISEELGVTRNAVLGRTFRLGLCKTYSEPRKPTAVGGSERASIVKALANNKMLPEQFADRIRDLRDMGATWNEIAGNLGISMATARNYAQKFGILSPVILGPPFSPDDHAYIIKAWEESVPVEDMADKLGRSFGAVRQQIFKLRLKKIIHSRDPAKTRLLKQYGEAALIAGATASEALKKISEAKQAMFAAAINASRAAKRARYDRALEEMRQAIKAGTERDAAIFACRSEGVHLEEIASEFGITRERVRQICNNYASALALRSLMA